MEELPQPAKPTVDLIVSTWGPGGHPIREKAGINEKRDKIIRTMAKTLGAACTCSGRTDYDKNLAMATRLYEGLEKQGLV